MIKIIFIRHGESNENIAMEDGKSYDKNNIKLTKLGREQAEKTGKYLYETFGKFDLIFTSPIKRCVETTEIISKEIKYSGKIIEDKLLSEIGNPFAGLSTEERNKIIKKNTKLINTWKKIEETKDPFEKFDLRVKERQIYENDYYFTPNNTESTKNCKKFLNKLKKEKSKNILVISHWGTIDTILRILCNLDNISIPFILSSKSYKEIKEIFGNCSCFYVGLKDSKYHIVMPPNTYHLES